jgi:SAM-dependent methyltransferase
VRQNRVHDLAHSYEDVAVLYEAGRPTYPAAAFGWLRDELSIGPGRTVLDLGAGTGKFTRLLVPTGARVIAVEPIEAMRGELKRAVHGVDIVAGSAADMPFGSETVDIVTVAQAFHWFAEREDIAEMHRVLRPDGYIGIIGNRRDRTIPVWSAIEDVVGPMRPKGIRTDWRSAFPSADFGPLHEVTFAREYEATPGQISMRVASMSWVAALPATDREHVLESIGEIARECAVSGFVTLREETDVAWSRRS